jgi:glycerol-3-phosphate dehydrogenase
VQLHDAITGETLTVTARAVINAGGVWAGEIDPSVMLRPSRGTHLVVETARLGGSDVSLTAPVPGSSSRFVFTVPGPHGRTYVGLTDVPADGPVPDVPEATDAEIDMLLATIGEVLAEPLTRADILSTFAGLRPLMVDPGGTEETSDLSRRHAVLESPDGVLSAVGGKLTTYRRMAQDAVDEAVRRRALPSAQVSRTRALPLTGAWPRERSSEILAPPRFVRRYGAEAPFVAGLPAGPGAARGVTAQELQWGVAVEGALGVADLLDRRTRLGLVPGDAEASVPAARAAFDRAGVDPLLD